MYAQTSARVRSCAVNSFLGFKVNKNNMRFYVCMSLIAVAACSSAAAKQEDPINSDLPAPVSSPAGDVADASVPEDDSPAMVDAAHVVTQAECIATCESAHPKAAALNKQLDNTCFFAGACEPVCNALAAGGKLSAVTVHPDASAACVIGEGVDPIMTASAKCSDCLAETPACCSLWIAIFGSAEGRDLNKCAVACYSK